MADVVVINKSDLNSDKTEEIKTEIHKINPFAEFRESIFCAVDFEMGKIFSNKIYFTEVKPLPRPEINSMVIKSGKKITPENLEIFLNEWAPKAYRIKGFVNLTNGKTVAVQCTFGSVETIKTETSFQNSELIALTDEFTLREWSQAFRNMN
jgi:G3E family GTPase